jgi:uncharacterized protein YjbI with pentapeptide repeats
MKLGNTAWLTTIVSIAMIACLQTRTASASDLSARDVTIRLFEAKPGERVDFSDLNLTLIDLSGLNFKKAILTGADLYGADVSHANLSGADLSAARLDRMTIIGADFSGADLTDATMLRPTAFTDTRFDRSEAPVFNGAKLVRTRIFGRLDGALFQKADLTQADFSPLSSGSNTIAVLPFNKLSGANFAGAVMHGVNLQQGKLEFANFRDADLRDADLRAADLTGADFTGADLSGANFAGAIVDRARLSGAKGLKLAKGLGVAVRPEDNGLKRP